MKTLISLSGRTNVKLKDKIISYMYTAGFGMVLCLVSAAMIGGIIMGLIMLLGGE